LSSQNIVADNEHNSSFPSIRYEKKDRYRSNSLKWECTVDGTRLAPATRVVERRLSTTQLAGALEGAFSFKWVTTVLSPILLRLRTTKGEVSRECLGINDGKEKRKNFLENENEVIRRMSNERKSKTLKCYNKKRKVLYIRDEDLREGERAKRMDVAWLSSLDWVLHIWVRVSVSCVSLFPGRKYQSKNDWDIDTWVTSMHFPSEFLSHHSYLLSAFCWTIEGIDHRSGLRYRCLRDVPPSGVNNPSINIFDIRVSFPLRISQASISLWADGKYQSKESFEI